jgi:hypothetical protein
MRPVFGILAGVVLTLLVILAVVQVFFPNDLLLFVIPMYVASIVGWLYAYWVMRKKVIR